MKIDKISAFGNKVIFAVTIGFSIVFINSCKKNVADPNESSVSHIKPYVVDCGPGYHWDFTLRACVPDCQSGYTFCATLGYCIPSSQSCPPAGGGTDVDNFRNSSDFVSFSNSNPAIVAKIHYDAAKVRVDYNQLYDDDIKAIYFPVIESTGDTSAVIIGIPTTMDNVTNYLIFYQNNQLLIRDASGHYFGQINADLYNTTTSYTAQINSSFQVTSDSIIAGPRWINNYSCNTCRLV
jgi:hypothetical protein